MRKAFPDKQYVVCRWFKDNVYQNSQEERRFVYKDKEGMFITVLGDKKRVHTTPAGDLYYETRYTTISGCDIHSLLKDITKCLNAK